MLTQAGRPPAEVDRRDRRLAVDQGCEGSSTPGTSAFVASSPGCGGRRAPATGEQRAHRDPAAASRPALSRSSGPRTIATAPRSCSPCCPRARSSAERGSSAGSARPTSHHHRPDMASPTACASRRPSGVATMSDGPAAGSRLPIASRSVPATACSMRVSAGIDRAVPRGSPRHRCPHPCAPARTAGDGREGQPPRRQ